MTPDDGLYARGCIVGTVVSHGISYLLRIKLRLPSHAIKYLHS